jgi:lambda repressor-like predicted transcriptional regulator
MNKLSTKERAQILAVLCEGMGINALSRETGASKNTILKLLDDSGEAAPFHQTDQRIQQEIGKPHACNKPVLHVLQLLQNS